jgi:N-acetylmuramoyl-L-alanine amidase
LFNLGVKSLLGLLLSSCVICSPVVVLAQQQSLQVVYPPPKYQTNSDRVFVLGTAPPAKGEVLINGKPVKRSKSGHFASSLALQLGENLLTVSYQNQAVQIKVTRVSTQPELPPELGFAKDSLSPATDIARLPGEPICFSAIAKENASVSVKLGNQTIPLRPQPQQAQLPSNLAALTGRNQPFVQSTVGKYEGCTVGPGVDFSDNTKEVDLGKPEFQLTLDGKTITQQAPGKITILSPAQQQVVAVTAAAGVARTGPSTDYSRLTPLPQGTQAAVTGREGDWLRLDYGGWIKSQETTVIPKAIPPRSIIRSVGYRRKEDRTEIIFPLQIPVPLAVQQSDRVFTLTLYNTTAQTDIIHLDDDPLIARLDWQQVAPGQVQYTFHLKKDQQWGYKLKYERTTLVLSLRHPPTIPRSRRQPLSGIKILLDPGHGGKESGAPGPNGLLEKDVNLALSKLLQQELVHRGATVVMTRQDDREVSLVERQNIIDKEEPVISISIHHNSLPDDGDVENTKGMAAFWYHPQAHSLAIFLQNYLVKKLQRPYYGVFWDNLALTRPSIAPSVLLELGFMSNPEEFEWLSDPKQQKKTARAIADGIVKWFDSVR